MARVQVQPNNSIPPHDHGWLVMLYNPQDASDDGEVCLRWYDDDELEGCKEFAEAVARLVQLNPPEWGEGFLEAVERQARATSELIDMEAIRAINQRAKARGESYSDDVCPHTGYNDARVCEECGQLLGDRAGEDEPLCAYCGSVMACPSCNGY